MKQIFNHWFLSHCHFDAERQKTVFPPATQVSFHLPRTRIGDSELPLGVNEVADLCVQTLASYWICIPVLLCVFRDLALNPFLVWCAPEHRFCQKISLLRTPFYHTIHSCVYFLLNCHFCYESFHTGGEYYAVMYYFFRNKVDFLRSPRASKHFSQSHCTEGVTAQTNSQSGTVVTAPHKNGGPGVCLHVSPPWVSVSFFAMVCNGLYRAFLHVSLV